MNYIKVPQDIETKSFEIIQSIIDDEHPNYQFNDQLNGKITKRCIHTSADFEWMDILQFSPQVIENIKAAIREGVSLYTDTNMALSGINKNLLTQFNCPYHCYVAHPDVATMAKEKGITRSMAAVDKALMEPGKKLFVFGNAPTALFRLLESYEKTAPPIAVVGVPVGFVGAEESKNELIESDLPFIAAKGRKGGSNIAAAIINAILYDLK